MIKNIVFDLGNVLVEFDSNKMISHFFNSRQQEVKSFYFDSLWNEYDQGLYTMDEMIEKGVKEFPELETNIVDLMHHWTQFVIPIWKNIEYTKTLRNLGYNVYILSNIPEDDTMYLKNLHIFDHINGGVFSYQVKLIKPNPKIFETLLKSYSLNANECLFLDDRKENIESAKRMGFKTIEVSDAKKVVDLLKESLDEV